MRILAAGFALVALLGSAAVATGAADTAVPKPGIVWKPIVFGAKRKAEMAAYAKRHYGIDSWRLVHPRVIVEHYTAATTFSSTYNYMA